MPTCCSSQGRYRSIWRSRSSALTTRRPTPSSSSRPAIAAAAAASSGRIMRAWGASPTSFRSTWRFPAAPQPRRRCCRAFLPRSPRPLRRRRHRPARPPEPPTAKPPLEIDGGSAIFRASAASEPPNGSTGEQMTGLLRYESPLDRALGAFFAPVNGSASVAGGSIDLDVVETPEAYVVKAEVLGVAQDKVEARDVTIAVEYREELEPNGKALWRERSFGKASRAIRLPEAVDANVAQAKHVDGVLQLTLPKIVKVSAKQITIQ